MVQLLVSVSSIDETKIALDNGVDIIDLKHPASGALGALAFDVVEEIVRFVRTQDEARLITATIGDLPMHADLLVQSVEAIAASNVDVIKIGFFAVEAEPVQVYAVCLEALQKLKQQNIKLVAVLFAEYAYPTEMLDMLKNAGFYGVMIDTVYKNGATFMDYSSHEEMMDFAQQTKKKNLQFGLAGSLQLEHLSLVKQFKPDYIGLRGGLCKANLRINSLSADKVETARKLL